MAYAIFDTPAIHGIPRIKDLGQCVMSDCPVSLGSSAAKRMKLGCFRSSTISSSSSVGIAVGDERGRRDRGARPASPSAR